MTLQDSKEIIAKKYGYGGEDDTWDSFRHQYINQNVPGRFYDEAAELYAQSQVNEAMNKAIMLVQSDIMHPAKNYECIDELIEELKKLKR